MSRAPVRLELISRGNRVHLGSQTLRQSHFLNHGLQSFERQTYKIPQNKVGARAPQQIRPPIGRNCQALHAKLFCCFDTGHGILDNQEVRRRTSELVGSLEKNSRVGLAMDNIVSGNNNAETAADSEPLQNELNPNPAS